MQNRVFYNATSKETKLMDLLLAETDLTQAAFQGCILAVQAKFVTYQLKLLYAGNFFENCK